LIDILLVEDNPDHAILIKRVLEDYKVSEKVHIVEDGEEALDFIYHRGKYSNGHNPPRPGLVLLDLKLPKMDGFKVLRQLKSDPDYKSIPVVILTTSSRDEEIAKGYAEGANSYVTKPVNFDEFTDKVRSIGLYWSLVNPIAEQNNI
jgi:two-component system response regulator